MRKVYIYLFYFILIIGLIGLILSPSEGISAAASGVDICINIIVPSLFPFFVLSSMIITSGLAAQTGKLLEPIMKPVFNVNGSCSVAFILGLVSGYPVGAKTAISLYRSNLCTKAEAERLLSFCNNTGPAFILGTVGIGMWKSLDAGILLFAGQITASIFTGILFGRLWKRKSGQISFTKTKIKYEGIINSFIHGVKSSAVSVLYICAFIVFFSVVIRLLTLSNIIPAASSFLSLITGNLLSFDYAKQLLTGFFEITTGIKSGTNGILNAKSLAVGGAVLGWAGLSVHCQVLAFLSGSGLSSKPYILGKSVQSLISAVITYFLALVFPIDKDVFLSYSKSFTENHALSFIGVLAFSIIIISSLFLLSVLALFLFRLFRRKA